MMNLCHYLKCGQQMNDICLVMASSMKRSPWYFVHVQQVIDDDQDTQIHRSASSERLVKEPAKTFCKDH